MTCLRAASTNTLALAGSQTLANCTSSFYPFGPIADGLFIQERPVEAFHSGKFARVPVLFGSNTNEGALWCDSLADPAVNTANPNANETTCGLRLTPLVSTMSLPPLESTYGSGLISLFLETILYGIGILQFFLYFQWSPKDKWSIKSFALVVM
ncbi:hypothetical protein B0H12DRAFT_1245708 [Mycena haematopus]|nr:hypothetical protein B0H12DRAFT_1245708 [Mycena haematopus]